ncbi:MAG: condensation domain-containing protein, partial [Gluconobacter cerinus]|uniref:condensation domain-containing protein n=1 Tax=Gluconobacter cerinus TaxID=38307 RepID=UPI0039E95DEE
MQHETISDRVDHARRQNCKIPVLSPPFCVPLTSMQQEIFVACEFRPDDNFNVCGRLDFEYETSLDLILEALIKVIQYNLNLNMRPVRKSDGIVFDRSGDGRLLAIDISALADPEAELSDWISRDVATVRGLDTDAVFELIAFKLKNKTFCVYYRFHHIIIDGYSGYLFSKQLVQYILQDPNSNYKDFKIIDYIKFINKSIDSEKKAKSDLEISFWKDYLSNYEKDSLLSHVKCSGLPSLEDKSTDYLSFLRNEFISEENIHFPTFFIACVAILISKISCKDAIYLSIPVTARERSTKELMSSFSNIIPIKVQLQPDSKFFEVYDTVKCEIRKVLRHSKTRGEFIYHNFFSSGGCTFGPLINILEFEFPNKMEEGHCKLQNLSSGPRPEVTFTAVRINDDAYDISITGPDDYKY